LDSGIKRANQMKVNSDLCAALNKQGYRLSIYGTASGYVLASVRKKETPR